MYALNFYSPIVADQLRSRRKTATIRLGDKSGKYKKGMVVQILVGQRYGPREKIFDAVIDKVEVKRLMELSPREIEHDNPEIRRPEDMTKIAALRQRLKKDWAGSYGVNPTFLAFVARATVDTLKDYPWVNGEIRGDSIVTRNYVNLGFAVELADGKGLIVPVVRNAETLNLLGMRDLREHGVDVVTIGQYLQPSSKHAQIDRWVHPDEFRWFREQGEELGFGSVFSGPLVRSSYRADEQRHAAETGRGAVAY